MKVKVPVIVKDPEVSEYKEIHPTEEIAVEEDIFLDGPVSPRVAILDFDPDTGALTPGVVFQRPAASGKVASYAIDQEVMPGDQRVSPQAAAVSAFGVVYKALKMFEEKDALGRRVSWAFNSPQLLVVPRAGNWANAYYERDSHSLQFFRFPVDDDTVVHTSHSQDIIAHETAHAVLDGVAPDLYDAISPQALAIHEAIADLTALLCSFRCRELAARVLEQMGGQLDRSTAFSGLAEQFGAALDEGRPYLRDLNNTKSLRPDAPPSDRVRPSDPHALSEVMSGSFYRVLVKMYDQLRDQFDSKRAPDPELVAEPESEYVQKRVVEQAPMPVVDTAGVQAKALFVASERLKRTIFRGLDYLPPGDVSFADLARAVLASDEASHPQSNRQRTWLVEEFVKRGIVATADELAVRTNFDHEALADVNLEELVQSDYVAYNFADDHRDLLGISPDVTFEVRPRLDVTKRYWHRTGEEEVRECLFKVAWTEIEESVNRAGLPRQRRWTAGTTLALSWTDPPRVRALLTTRRKAGDRQATDALLLRLIDEDQLRVGDAARGPDDLPLRGKIAADVIDGALRVKGMGKTLHIIREAS